jgi:hypothetical protein
MRHHDLCDVAQEVGDYLVTAIFCRSNPFLDGFDGVGRCLRDRFNSVARIEGLAERLL